MNSRVSVLLCIIPVALALQSRGLGDLDIITQVKLGLVSLTDQDFSLTFPLSISRQLNLGWFSQLAFGLSFQIAGWDGVRVLNTLLVTCSFAIILWPVLLFKDKLLPGILAVLIALLVMLPSIWVRPQSFALLFFAIFLWLVQIRTIGTWHKVLIGGITLVIWQNFHPSTLMALPLILLFTLELPKKLYSIFPAAVFLIFWLIAQIATIDGLNALESSSLNYEISRNVFAITEWLPPWYPSIIAVMTPFLWIATFISLLSLALFNRLRWQSVFLHHVFLFFSLFASRFSVFYGLAAIPLIFEIMEQVFGFDLRLNKRVGVAILTITAFAILIISIRRPLQLQSELSYDLIERNLKSYFVRDTRIFNCRELAGSILFSGYPLNRIYYDGRLYLHDAFTWTEYLHLSSGPESAEKILANRPIDLFILCKSYQSDLINLLLSSGKWALKEEDDFSAIVIPMES